MSESPPVPAYTIASAAKHIGTSKITINKMLKIGSLKPIIGSKITLLTKDSVELWKCVKIGGKSRIIGKNIDIIE